MSDVEFSDVIFLHGVYVQLQDELDAARDDFYTAVEKLINEGASAYSVAKVLGISPIVLSNALSRRKKKVK